MAGSGTAAHPRRSANQPQQEKTTMAQRLMILATDGFEQSELLEPRQALNKAGFETVVVSPQSGTIKGWKGGDWGDTVKVDATLDEVSADDFAALVLPGGQINPDKLRMEQRAVALVKAFAEAGKPVAAICHGPWLLVEAGVVSGRTVTGWPSIRTDLANAGGNVVDQEVAIDGNLITSRKPDDIPAFSEALICVLQDQTAPA
jgi:protease I